MTLNGYNFNETEQKEIDTPGVYVYILQLSNGRYYTGISKNLVKRLIEHNKGLSRSTKHGRPVILKYIVKFSNYKDARWLEKKIKNRGARNYLYHNR